MANRETAKNYSISILSVDNPGSSKCWGGYIKMCPTVREQRCTTFENATGLYGYDQANADSSSKAPGSTIVSVPDIVSSC